MIFLLLNSVNSKHLMIIKGFLTIGTLPEEHPQQLRSNR